LWLFGYVIFCASQGDAVSRFLIPHAWRIADATVEEMPQINWSAAVLAATYRGSVHWVHQDWDLVNPPGMPASAALVELRAASRRSAIGRPIAVPDAGGGARPSRQANHGVDVVPPLGSYFKLTSFVSYPKVMQFGELTHSLVYNSLGRSRPGGRTWTSSARLTTSRTVRLSGSSSPTPWSSRVHCMVPLPCAFETVTSG
jgi:hypothetical protein